MESLNTKILFGPIKQDSTFLSLLISITRKFWKNEHLLFLSILHPKGLGSRLTCQSCLFPQLEAQWLSQVIYVRKQRKNCNHLLFCPSVPYYGRLCHHQTRLSQPSLLPPPRSSLAVLGYVCICDVWAEDLYIEVLIRGLPSIWHKQFPFCII